MSARVRVSEATIWETRVGLVQQLAELYPLQREDGRTVKETSFTTNADGQIVGKVEVERADVDPRPLAGFLTSDEVRIASRVPFAIQTGPGRYEFDWRPLQEALGRGLSSLDIRTLRESAIRASRDSADVRLAALAASIEDAGG
jgi:hypothetical protein